MQRMVVQPGDDDEYPWRVIVQDDAYDLFHLDQWCESQWGPAWLGPWTTCWNGWKFTHHEHALLMMLTWG